MAKVQAGCCVVASWEIKTPRVKVVQSNAETSTKFVSTRTHSVDSHQKVAFLVQSQVIGAGEAALAVGALERFDPRVLAEVSRQLV